MMSGCHSIELHVMYPLISDYISSSYICNSVRQCPPNPYHLIHGMCLIGHIIWYTVAYLCVLPSCTGEYLEWPEFNDSSWLICQVTYNYTVVAEWIRIDLLDLEKRQMKSISRNAPWSFIIMTWWRPCSRIQCCLKYTIAGCTPIHHSTWAIIQVDMVEAMVETFSTIELNPCPIEREWSSVASSICLHKWTLWIATIHQKIPQCLIRITVTPCARHVWTSTSPWIPTSRQPFSSVCHPLCVTPTSWHLSPASTAHFSSLVMTHITCWHDPTCATCWDACCVCTHICINWVLPAVCGILQDEIHCAVMLHSTSYCCPLKSNCISISIPCVLIH